MKNSENTKRNTKRTVIAVLICLAVVLAVILAIAVACSGEDNEEISNQSVSMVMDGSSSEGNDSSQEETTQTVSNDASDAISDEGSQKSDETSDESEPIESSTDESKPSDVTGDEPEESSKTEQSKPVESSQPEETSKPNETSQPNQPVDTKEYHTEWGTRPFEFEVGNDYRAGDSVIPYAGATIMEHNDRYNNTWYTYNGKVIGNGSIFYMGSSIQIHGTAYLGRGYWSNGACWWKEGDSNIYNMPVITNFEITNPQKLLGTPDDMQYGHLFAAWWSDFIEDFLGARSVALQCNNFESFFEEFKNVLQQDKDVWEFWKEDYELYFSNRNFYSALNINSYTDLMLAMADPFSFQFSNYTHKF